jgi:short-subunit dehydrogenase involved in D-alanine esterification of teichoic acids
MFKSDAALKELLDNNPAIETFHCDIAVRPDVLALAMAIQDRYGRLDVLINNAGIMEQVELLDESVSDDRIAYEISVNLTGTILLTRRLLPLLRVGRDPLIVMITSGYALLPATLRVTTPAMPFWLPVLLSSTAAIPPRCIPPTPPGSVSFRACSEQQVPGLR